MPLDRRERQKTSIISVELHGRKAPRRELGLKAGSTTIDCLVLDVDGVLTDGRLWYRGDAEPARAFHTQDGFAIRWFLRLGGEVILLTGKRSIGVAVRAAELGIRHVLQGSEDKLADLSGRLATLSISLPRVAMIGDDLPDLPVLRACGLPIAVANAVDDVKAVCGFVTRRPGGQGAVREAIEHILRADGRWSRVLEHYGAVGADRA